MLKTVSIYRSRRTRANIHDISDKISIPPDPKMCQHPFKVNKFDLLQTWKETVTDWRLSSQWKHFLLFLQYRFSASSKYYHLSLHTSSHSHQTTTTSKQIIGNSMCVSHLSVMMYFHKVRWLQQTCAAFRLSFLHHQRNDKVTTIIPETKTINSSVLALTYTVRLHSKPTMYFPFIWCWNCSSNSQL